MVTTGSAGVDGKAQEIVLEMIDAAVTGEKDWMALVGASLDERLQDRAMLAAVVRIQGSLIGHLIGDVGRELGVDAKTFWENLRPGLAALDAWLA